MTDEDGGAGGPRAKGAPGVQVPSGAKDKALFQPNLEVLARGLKAPLPLAPNSRLSLRGAFRLALERAGVSPAQAEPASAIGGGLIHAFQESVLALNRLLSEPRAALPEAVKSLLWSTREILGFSDSAYALKQAVEAIEGSCESLPENFREMKDLSEPLERRLEALGLPVLMDPVRFAVLQVHLDELYDQAARQLQLFYQALALQDPKAQFGAFSRKLASAAVKEIIPDLILGVGAGPGREHTGLADLLPELERELN